MLIFLAEFFNSVQRGGFGFGHQRVNPEFFRKFKNLPAPGLIRRQLHRAQTDHLDDAVGFQFGLDGLLIFFFKGNGADAVGAIQAYLAGKTQVMQPQRGGFVNGFENGKFPERVGMHGELPAELVRRAGGNRGLGLKAGGNQDGDGQQ